MNFLDWLGLGVMLTTLIGATVQPADFTEELNRTTPGQVQATAGSPTADLSVGGASMMRYADSGVSTAQERALECKTNLSRVIGHYNLPNHYIALGLRLSGDRDHTRISYLDFPITSVTAADAKANGVDNARTLAERWRNALDKEMRVLPQPLPNGWIATTGRPSSSLMVSDSTLAFTVAECLNYGDGQRVKVTTQGGLVVLEGQVASAKERGRLLRTVEQIPGVRGVVDKTAIAQ